MSSDRAHTPYVPPSARSSLTFNPNIHYLRGIASLLVVLSHSGFYLNSYLDVSWGVSVFPDTFGLYGVAVFFTLSGYLMARLIDKEQPADFLARRIVRIYPLFIICTFFTMFALFPQVISRWVPLSLTLAPMDDATYLMRVEWTIVHEVFFYVIVFLVSVLRLTRVLPLVAILWIVAIGLNAYFRVPMPPIGRADITDIGLMSGNAGFAFGLLVPTLIKRVHMPLLAFFAFVSLIFLQYTFSAYYHRIFAGLASAFLVVAAVQCEVVLPRILSWLLTKFGDWSYALYLIHVPVLTYVFTVHQGGGVLWMAWPLATGLAIFMGALFGEVDQMIVGKTKSAVKGASRTTLNIVAVVFMTLYLVASCLSLTMDLTR